MCKYDICSIQISTLKRSMKKYCMIQNLKRTRNATLQYWWCIQTPYIYIYIYGCGIILGINFLFFLGIIFFLWFQFKLERFQVGVGQSPFPQRKKAADWIVKAASPPDALGRSAYVVFFLLQSFTVNNNNNNNDNNSNNNNSSSSSNNIERREPWK